MTQEMFPEIKTASEALQTRIALTEAEIAQLRETIAAKKEQLRSWRKAIAAFSPQGAPKKRVEAREN
ncbi:MAG TPA: hypothetical protein VHC20_04225 [Candidatus Paceibacterota bacterium]|jgi:hypothetical protein|nr:hypothetical protein [Candidatus Paceibacterota bacterium]